MAENNQNEILEAVHALASHVDDRFNEVDDRLNKVDDRLNKVDDRLNKVDDRLNKVEKQIGQLRSDVIDHVSRTVNNAKGDIVAIIKTDRERFKLFNVKMLAIIERNKLAEPEEVATLRELVA